MYIKHHTFKPFMECPVCDQQIPANEFLLHALHEHPQFFAVWASFSMPTFAPAFVDYIMNQNEDELDLDNYSYEDLLQLCDQIGYHSVGVKNIDDVSTICSYTDVDKNWICSICLESSCENGSYRKITKCSHTFCDACIKPWLECHKSCPVCKQDVSLQTTSSLDDVD